MSNKNDSTVQEEPKFSVSGLQCGEMFGAEVGVQVAGLDARELRQIIHDLFLSRNIIIYERSTLQTALSETH